MPSFVINLIVAVIWLLLSPQPSLGVFARGFILGFVLLTLFEPVLGNRQYTRRTWAFFRFLLVFLREFLLANLAVVRTVLFESRQSLYPNFITLDVTGMKPFEIVLLSYCITLTPGTTSVEIEDHFQTLIVHALNAKRPAEVRRQMERSLKSSMLQFTR